MRAANVSMYVDRDGDVWAVRDSDGAAMNVVLDGDVADDQGKFDNALFTGPYVERQYGPLRLLVAAPEDDTVKSSPEPVQSTLADVLAEIHARMREAFFDTTDGSAEERVFQGLTSIFADAARQAEGGTP